MRESNSTFPTELFPKVEKTIIAASRLPEAQFRLNAQAFLSQDLLATLIPRSSNTQKLHELADVFTVYIQSPILAYVTPFPKSRPYMTTSELAEYQTGRATHVSLVADPRLIAWEIKEGNIVVSRSGRVGETYWIDRKLDGVLVGDSFRVVPKNPDDGFFLYAVLVSDFARSYLSGSAYGSVVDHASLDQLRAFPLPPVSPRVKSQIANKVRDALAARQAAYDLLNQAQEGFLKANALQPLKSQEAPLESGKVVSVTVSCAEVISPKASPTEFRLEAHFYNPAARTAIAGIQKSPSPKYKLADLTRDVIMGSRFKRNYVEAAHGTPFLSGRNIIQIRPTDLKHLSNSETSGLQDLLIKKGWILVTCSGTIGRTCFVWRNFENYAASQHILRVLPDQNEVDPGYLYAFLASDYGYHQILRFRHGSVIDELTDQQLKKLIIPLAEPSEQEEIGDNVRLAYDKRAEALKLEGEAQELLLREIKGVTAKAT
jgi:type I restriction enzyme S subunit